ncbi:hypothetical protein BJ138DRAFT_1151688, partial [Hygrophoropsis aurantiaca]
LLFSSILQMVFTFLAMGPFSISAFLRFAHHRIFTRSFLLFEPPEGGHPKMADITRFTPRRSRSCICPWLIHSIEH